eukprot:TRINITY_DN38572_c0_g1_i1.p4 TRINITY_DN38572_c0_g1~~TRINITY_DN38572_c0_g1_i1.p4  ORF type:complete len:117 (+),score=15.02 TRINITY_DN38572_c0_g1_i1:30-353(+)
MKEIYKVVFEQLMKYLEWQLRSIFYYFAEEFHSWLRWMIYDTVMHVLIDFLSKHSDYCKQMFVAFGWCEQDIDNEDEQQQQMDEQQQQQTLQQVSQQQQTLQYTYEE